MDVVDHTFVDYDTFGFFSELKKGATQAAKLASQKLKEGVSNMTGNGTSKLIKQREKVICKRPFPEEPKSDLEAMTLYKTAIDAIKEMQDVNTWIPYGLNHIGVYALILNRVQEHQHRFYGKDMPNEYYRKHKSDTDEDERKERFNKLNDTLKELLSTEHISMLVTNHRDDFPKNSIR